MKKYHIFFILTFISSCAGVKYSGWEKVRLSLAEPDSAMCTFEVQEICHPPEIFSKKAQYFEGCYNWFKKRATIFEANTVFIQREQSGATDGIASYYNCSLKPNKALQQD